MSEQIPNHICKYSKCNKGVDSQGNPCQKHYYSCDPCKQYAQYLEVTCCPEHYQAYMREVLISRNEWTNEDEDRYNLYIGKDIKNIKVDEINNDNDNYIIAGKE